MKQDQKETCVLKRRWGVSMKLNTLTAIENVHVFDGERVLGKRTVVIKGSKILNIGNWTPNGAEVVNGEGAMLLPGLIDAHTHTDINNLEIALRFGVTTELEMQGFWTPEERKEVAERYDVADVRSAGLGITPPNGHPTELVHADANEQPGETPDDGEHRFPFTDSPQKAAEIVAERVSQGFDYIKIMVEDGTVFGKPGTPMVSDEIIATTTHEAHQFGKIVLAHTLTQESAKRAIAGGVDGLAHIFIDSPITDELIHAITESGAFVIPTLSVNSSVIGIKGAELASDPRVSSKLPPVWLKSLKGAINTYPQGNFEDILANVRALHEAGVDILAGSDVSMPLPNLGGSAHGASLHHELQLLVKAGFEPIEALMSATSITARRFSLYDRGRIVNGARADLLLVNGDPTKKISDTLSIKGVWKAGVRLADKKALNGTIFKKGEA